MVRISYGNSVCPFVPLSQLGTDWSLHDIYKDFGFSPHDSLVSSISWQNFMTLGEGGPHERGAKQGHPLKRRYSTHIGLSDVKMVADRHRHAACHNKHWR